jgi:hypothetical protein
LSDDDEPLCVATADGRAALQTLATPRARSTCEERDGEILAESPSWWAYHTSFSADELPSPTTHTAGLPNDPPRAVLRRLRSAVRSRGLDSEAQVREELAKATYDFYTTWRALGALRRRRLRNRPLLHVLPPTSSDGLPVPPCSLPLSPDGSSRPELAQTPKGGVRPSTLPGSETGRSRASFASTSSFGESSPSEVGGSSAEHYSTRRLRPSLEADEGAPPGVRWGVARVQRRRSCHAGAMPLAVSADGSSALCLSCYVPLRTLPTGFSPGPSPQSPRDASPQAALESGNGHRAAPESDTELFCSGRCKANYAARRRTGSLRRQLLDIDGATCAACGLDAAGVCQALSEAPPGEPRVALLRRLAPAIAEEARLASRLVEAPHLAGNVWHADHRVAVVDGGGECTVENMQVLCVACHLKKTRDETRERRTRRAAIAAASSGAPDGSAPDSDRSRGGGAQTRSKTLRPSAYFQQRDSMP